MNHRMIVSLVSSLACASIAAETGGSATTLERMPMELETRYALSAAPPPLRKATGVYVLDPETGYTLSKQGTNGVICIVARTAWEMVDFRNDIYVPLCYDAAGAKTYLRVLMDVAALRARGMNASRLKAEIQRRWKDGIYTVPKAAGVSYMISPVIRTAGPPDMQVRTMVMPHIMFYAPHVTNEDIGSVPDPADLTSLQYPFVFQEGIAEQSYMIQLVGEAEKDRILKEEEALIDELCEYREILCASRDH